MRKLSNTEAELKKSVAYKKKRVDELNSKHDNILIIADLNSEMSEPSLYEFCQTYNLESIVNKPTCFKNHKNPSGIDLVLINKQERFLKAKAVETWLDLTFINGGFCFSDKLQKAKAEDSHISCL